MQNPLLNEHFISGSYENNNKMCFLLLFLTNNLVIAIKVQLLNLNIGAW